MAVKQELRPFMHVRKFPSSMAVYPLHAGNKWKGIKVRRKVKDGAQNSLIGHDIGGFWHGSITRGGRDESECGAASSCEAARGRSLRRR